jgi:hypothetical protein
MKHIPTYEQFINETDVVGHDEITATKPTALSEEMCEAVDKCMEMAMNEAIAWNEDEHKEHTAEGYMNACENYIKESMNKIREQFSNIAGFNRTDGDMRQGTVQDVPVMSGAVR